MRNLWRGWVAALGGVVLTAAVCSAQPAGVKKDLAESPPFWSEWFNWSGKPTPPRPVPVKDMPAGKAEKEKGLVAPQSATTEEKKAELHLKARNAFERRDAVILRLQEIAAESGDAALEAEALRLAEMARRLYQRESNSILGVVGGPGVVGGEQALEKGNAVKDSGAAIRAASEASSGPVGGSATVERSVEVRGKEQ